MANILYNKLRFQEYRHYSKIFRLKKKEHNRKKKEKKRKEKKKEKKEKREEKKRKEKLGMSTILDSRRYSKLRNRHRKIFKSIGSFQVFQLDIPRLYIYCTFGEKIQVYRPLFQVSRRQLKIFNSIFQVFQFDLQDFRFVAELARDENFKLDYHLKILEYAAHFYNLGISTKDL